MQGNLGKHTLGNTNNSYLILTSWLINKTQFMLHSNNNDKGIGMQNSASRVQKKITRKSGPKEDQLRLKAKKSWNPWLITVVPSGKMLTTVHNQDIYLIKLERMMF